VKKVFAGVCFGVCLCFVLLSGCRKEADVLQAESGEEFSGGNGTVFDISPNAFSQQIPGLTSDDGLQFFVGNSFFNQNWVTAPSSTTARDGLGPLFNARSCSTCHFKDGRGLASIAAGDGNNGLLLRLSIPGVGPHGEPVPDPVYGDQLQVSSIESLEHEGDFNIIYTTVSGQYPDGAAYILHKPLYQISNLQYGSMAASQVSPRIAQQMIGLGLLEAVSEQTLMGFEDPGDANGDGISGRLNRVWDAKKNAVAIGRFGWKANQPSIFQQVCGAFLGDMGITTSLFSSQNCGAIPGCNALADGGTPEIMDNNLQKVVLYSSTLAVPARRDWTNPDVLKGKQLFNSIGCASCHIPKMVTGTHSITGLGNQVIRPYTDMLLHDMGQDLADNRPDFEAGGSEWRTQPLWGIGLIQTVNKHVFLMHDGRARTIEEAILWHGGESEASKNNFMKLSKAERDNLVRFLNTL
jgi:CxxC motif-containing protein (DUF1111 family)